MPRLTPGAVIGRLTVISEAPSRPGGKGPKRYVLCKCICGVVKEIREDTLKTRTKSCGCLIREVAAERAKMHMSDGGHVTHGQSCTGAYSSWQAMRQRCLNKRSPLYAEYGAKGICIDPRWSTYENFHEDMGDRPKGTSIDRVDNKKGYGPDNCRWATKSEQMQNRSNSVRYLYKGKLRTLQELTDMSNVSKDTVYQRLRVLRWSVEDAVSLPLKAKARSKATHLRL